MSLVNTPASSHLFHSFCTEQDFPKDLWENTAQVLVEESEDEDHPGMRGDCDTSCHHLGHPVLYWRSVWEQ